tara:strand:- start:157 stop:819 length:663 start_codon:yes stop_codon:yes gene_type:complete
VFFHSFEAKYNGRKKIGIPFVGLCNKSELTKIVGDARRATDVGDELAPLPTLQTIMLFSIFGCIAIKLFLEQHHTKIMVVDANDFHKKVPRGKHKAFKFVCRKTGKDMHSCLGEFVGCGKSVKAENFSMIPKSAHKLIEEPEAEEGDEGEAEEEVVKNMNFKHQAHDCNVFSELEEGSEINDENDCDFCDPLTCPRCSIRASVKFMFQKARNSFLKVICF